MWWRLGPRIPGLSQRTVEHYTWCSVVGDTLHHMVDNSPYNVSHCTLIVVCLSTSADEGDT